MIIADENIDNHIIIALRKANIKIFSIAKERSGIDDKQVIEIAKQKRGIILTEDKDFGELVFAHNIKNISVIFLRYSFSQRDKIIRILINLITNKKYDLIKKFTTITVNKIRLRKI